MNTLPWPAFVGTFVAGVFTGAVLVGLALAAVMRRERQLRYLAHRRAIRLADQQLAEQARQRGERP